MAHLEQFQFIEMIRFSFPSFFDSKIVLEVGSLNINGSVREFFKDCNYTGIDVGPGPGVDIVCHGETYNAPAKIFDTVISCECFEHNPFWVETFKNMIRMCKSGGLIIMTCAGEGREEHGTARTQPHNSPLTVQIGWQDYYKNLTEQDFRNNISIDEFFSVYQFSEQIHSGESNPFAKDLNFWGIKK